MKNSLFLIYATKYLSFYIQNLYIDCAIIFVSIKKHNFKKQKKVIVINLSLFYIYIFIIVLTSSHFYRYDLMIIKQK